MAAQIFFAAVGAAGEVRAVVQTAPSLFVFCFLQIAIHLLLILGAGRLAGFTRKELLLASNANVGGAAFAMLSFKRTLHEETLISSCRVPRRT